MAASVTNRVRVQREARGLSQVALAERSGLTRQSVGAIEAGRATPSVEVALRIARALDCQVEDLFGAPRGASVVTTDPSGPAFTGRVALARVAGRWVSYPLVEGGARLAGDGLAVQSRRGAVDVEPFGPLTEALENVVVMGCASALGLLSDRLNTRSGPGRFRWFSRSSTAALEALASGRAHLAGVHLVDSRTGEVNVADVRRHLRDTPVVLVTLARWEAGLVTAPGNPRALKRSADLARRGLRVVTREKGSGARRLLDRELRNAGVPEQPRRASLQAAGHLEVAHAVAIGAGDVGIATRDAAIAFGLGFVPLAEERYDLVVPLAGMRDPRIARLLELMTTSAVRRELSSLGYDVRSCGDRVAELPAAGPSTSDSDGPP